MAIELRSEQIDSELPRFCIMRDGPLLVDEPMGYEEARCRAASLGLELGVAVEEVARSGERTTLYWPTARRPLSRPGPRAARVRSRRR